jgi:glycerate kinase
MKVLVAPDKFKGTLGAEEVAAAIVAGLDGPESDVCPVADGGEGTAALLLEAIGGEWLEAEVSDPLGRVVVARYAMLAGGEAIVEVAAASGLAALREDERDAIAASSRGTGELMVDAIQRGARRVVVACGGSATTDGGAGILEVFEPGSTEVAVLIDTLIPFEDAPRVYGPQKGASPGQVRELEKRLDRLAETLPRDPRGVPGTGAAGGISGGLWAHRAELVPGAAFVLDAIGFDERLARADVAFTGEGRLDETSLTGKAPAEVARRAAAAGVPCHAIVGQNRLDPQRALEAGFTSVTEASTPVEVTAAASAIS